MENKFENMSLIDIAYEIVKESEAGLPIQELLTKTLEAAGKDAADEDTLSNLYIEICTCSKFIYCIDDNGVKTWDLKTRHTLDEYDKDSSKFVTVDKDEESDDESDEDDEYSDDEDEDEESNDDAEADEDSEEDEDNKSEDSYSDTDEESDYVNDDDEDLTEIDEDDFDEDKYNSTMDEYEDKYDR